MFLENFHDSSCLIKLRCVSIMARVAGVADPCNKVYLLLSISCKNGACLSLYTEHKAVCYVCRIICAVTSEYVCKAI